MTIRAFISVDLDEPQLISKVRLVKGALSSLGLDMKLVEDENLHITLVFLGDLPDHKVGLVKDSLREVSHNAFKLHLKGVGCFPSCGRPRVIWIGAEEGAVELIELYSKVARALRQSGVSFKEERGYTPHLTVARVRSGRNVAKLARSIEMLSNEDFGWMEVREFRLKKSTLTPKGPIYETISSYKLL